MKDKKKSKVLEDPFADTIRESTVTMSITAGSIPIKAAQISKKVKLDLPRYKISKKIGELLLFKKKEVEKKKRA